MVQQRLNYSIQTKNNNKVIGRLALIDLIDCGSFFNKWVVVFIEVRFLDPLYIKGMG